MKDDKGNLAEGLGCLAICIGIAIVILAHNAENIIKLFKH